VGHQYEVVLLAWRVGPRRAVDVRLSICDGTDTEDHHGPLSPVSVRFVLDPSPALIECLAREADHMERVSHLNSVREHRVEHAARRRNDRSH